jgi:hypothetical protein
MSERDARVNTQALRKATGNWGLNGTCVPFSVNCVLPVGMTVGLETWNRCFESRSKGSTIDSVLTPMRDQGINYQSFTITPGSATDAARYLSRKLNQIDSLGLVCIVEGDKDDVAHAIGVSKHPHSPGSLIKHDCREDLLPSRGVELSTVVKEIAAGAGKHPGLNCYVVSKTRVSVSERISRWWR